MHCSSRKNFQTIFTAYEQACKNSVIDIGRLFVSMDSNTTSHEKTIINFPTKRDWRKPSEYHYIEEGLDDLIRIIKDYKLKSIAIPPLGSGNGGLDWEKVKKLIESKLSFLDVEILVYEPTSHIKDHLKKERVRLTDARALLLYVLYDLVRNGEYVSEFSSEKVCYFLQRFGAKKYFKLEYDANFYGPYSGKVRYLLNALNGSYVMGYSDMNKKPFEPLTLVADGYETVVEHIENKFDLLKIARKTVEFLAGFYSDFALELLSSIDYIKTKHQVSEKEEIAKKLGQWSDRKRSMFSNPRYIDLSMRHLKSATFE